MPSPTTQRQLAQCWLQGESSYLTIGRMSTRNQALMGCGAILAVRIGPSEHAGVAVLARSGTDNELSTLQNDYLRKLDSEAEAAAIPVVTIRSADFDFALCEVGNSAEGLTNEAFLDAIIARLAERCVDLLREDIIRRARSLANYEDAYDRARLNTAWDRYRECAETINRVCSLDARETPTIATFAEWDPSRIIDQVDEFERQISDAIAAHERAITEAASAVLEAWARGGSASSSGMRSRSFSRIRIRPSNPEIIESSNGGYCFSRADVLQHRAAILQAIYNGSFPSGTRVSLAGSSSLTIDPNGDVVIGMVTIPGADFERVIVQSGAIIPVNHIFRFLGQEPAMAVAS